MADVGKLLARAEEIKRERDMTESERVGLGVQEYPAEVRAHNAGKETSVRRSRGSVLDEAKAVINGERQDQYGDPEDSFELISDYWTTYLRSQSPEMANAGFCLHAPDVALMMTLFKIAREASQHKRDNIRDAAGYLGIYADMGDKS